MASIQQLVNQHAALQAKKQQLQATLDAAAKVRHIVHEHHFLAALLGQHSVHVAMCMAVQSAPCACAMQLLLNALLQHNPWSGNKVVVYFTIVHAACFAHLSVSALTANLACVRALKQHSQHQGALTRVQKHRQGRQGQMPQAPCSRHKLALQVGNAVHDLLVIALLQHTALWDT